MEKILVGIDGSPESRHAARVAADLAMAMGAQLTVACAVGPYTTVGADASQELVMQWEQKDRETAATLAREVAASVARPGLNVQALVPRGFPSDELAQMAQGYDLVVVGHRGRGRIARALLGSVADRLAQTCPKPLLIVRSEPDTADRGMADAPERSREQAP